MKIVGIVCSPRMGGNTEIMVQEVLEATRMEGAETELITIADKKIKPCDGCETCDTTGKCRINDDMQEIYEKLIQADGIILGTPVYFINVTAQAKTVIDRTYALLHKRKLRGKIGGAVAVARRTGAGTVLSYLYTYFVAQRMLIAGAAIGYGRKKGDVRQGTGGIVDSALEEARAMGRNVVRLIRQKM